MFYSVPVPGAPPPNSPTPHTLFHPQFNAKLQELEAEQLRLEEENSKVQ